MIITVFFPAFKLFFTGFFSGDGDAQAFQCLKFRAFQGDTGDGEQIMAPPFGFFDGIIPFFGGFPGQPKQG